MIAFDGMQPRIRQVPAKPVAFDQNRIETELAGADRGDITTPAAADDKDVGFQCFSHCELSLVVIPAGAKVYPREGGDGDPGTSAWEPWDFMHEHLDPRFRGDDGGRNGDDVFTRP